jgi:DNA-binding protein Alba
MSSDENIEKIYIGNKEIPKYLTACFFALGETDTINIIGRGNNVKGAVDVAAILLRQYLENPKYDIKIGSEKFEERYVSTIEIVINGEKKNIPKIKSE